jgi:hypothetical protein
MASSSREFTKVQRRRLRELCGLSYERDLSAELARLEADFQRWRANEIDAFELSDLIHRFHQGPSRELFRVYSQPHLPLAVASAIHRGVLAGAEVGAEMPELLRSQIERFRDGERE